MKKRILLPVMVAIAAVAAAHTNEPTAQGYIARGRLMFNDRNYTGCIDQLTHARTFHLSDTEVEETDFLFALSLLHSGDTQARDAFKRFLECHKSSPQRGNALMGLGDCEFALQRYGEALTAYRQVDRRTLSDYRCEDLRHRTGYCLLRLGEYPEAEKEFASLRNVKRYASSSRFYLGYIAYFNRDYDKAISLLDGCDRSAEPGSMADYYLAQIYFANGDNEKALATARQLLKRGNPGDPHLVAETHRIAGESLCNLNRGEDAVPYLQKYVSLSSAPMPSALYLLGVHEYHGCDYSQAIAHLTPATMEDNVMGQSALLYMGQCYRKTGNSDAALMAFDKSSHMEYDRDIQETAAYNYVVTRMNGGRAPFDSSVDALNGFLARFPSSRYAPQVREHLVALYIGQHEYTGALRCIEQIKNPSKDILTAKQHTLFALGTQSLASGQPAIAISHFNGAKSLASHNQDITRECDLWIGDCLYRQGKYNEAADSYRSYLRTAKASASNAPLAHYNLGYSLYATRQYDDAASSFSKAVNSKGRLDSRVIADAYNRLGDCHYYKSDFDTASKFYDRAAKTNSHAADYSLYQKAVLRGHSNDYSGKINLLSDIEKRFPQSRLMPTVLLEKAEAYIAIDDNKKAIDTYRRLVESHRESQQARNGLLQMAITFMSENDKDNAIKAYKDVITSYPATEEARTAADDLKRIYADEGRLSEYSRFISSVPDAPELDASEADNLTFQSAEKAYLTNSDTSRLKQYTNDYPEGAHRPQALHYLCTDAYSAGDLKTAFDYATRIVESHPDSPVIEDALIVKAEIEYNQGKGEAALESYRRLEQCASTPHNLKAARLGIMRVSHNLGRKDDVLLIAGKLLETLHADDGDIPEIKFTAALNAYRKRIIDEPLATWSELAKNTDNLYGAKSAVYLAEHYMSEGNLAKAHSTIEALIDSDTPHQYWLARGFIILSDINRAEGNTFEADEYLKTLRENYPGDEPDIFLMIENRLNKN